MKSSSASSAETERLGAALASSLRAGDLVLVSGELGSGKTTFVRGACRALGVEAPVTSPTFTIGQVYAGEPEIAHLDLYRLSAVDPAILEDYVTPERIAFIEWPLELESATHRVRLEHAGGDRRIVEVK
jgi:tRNA threonylcarbamoyladenosine biosynthesis protein TsaE